jgi:hypothetical protein
MSIRSSRGSCCCIIVVSVTYVFVDGVFTGVLIASAAFGLSDGYFQPHQLSMGHDGDRV